MSVRDFKRSIDGYAPFCFRNEWKNVYRAITRFEGDPGYVRFKALAVFDEEPSDEKERRCLGLLRSYWACLKDFGNLPLLLVESPKIPTPLELEDGQSLLEACALCSAFVNGLGQPPLVDVLALNVVLANAGLGTIRLRLRDRWDVDDPRFVLSSLLSTPRAPLRQESIPPLSKEEAILALSEIVRRYPIRRLIVFGSYSNATQVSGSDIDLAVVFDYGLTYQEKRAFLSSLSVAVSDSLRIPADVRESLDGSDEALYSRFGIFSEVPI